MNQFGKINWGLLIVLLTVILVLLIVLVVNLDKAQEQDPAMQTPGTQVTEPSDPTGSSGPEEKGLVIKNIEELGNEVVAVTTNYCQVQYPYAFSDMVKVEAVNEENKTALQFFALINGVNYKIYEIIFDGQGDLKIGTLSLEEGVRSVEVRATIYGPDPNLDENARLAFNAARETFNDVAMSLYENANFIPAN